MSLRSFVACWQRADADKGLDRWRLTRCDYLPLLELTVHQSRWLQEPGPADSIVARDMIFYDSMTSDEHKKMCQVFQVCCHTGTGVLLFRFINT